MLTQNLDNTCLHIMRQLHCTISRFLFVRGKRSECGPHDMRVGAALTQLQLQMAPSVNIITWLTHEMMFSRVAHLKEQMELPQCISEQIGDDTALWQFKCPYHQVHQ